MHRKVDEYGSEASSCYQHRGAHCCSGTLPPAQTRFATYTQELVDKIFQAAASAVNKMHIPLAKQAVSETGMGVVENKVIKKHYLNATTEDKKRAPSASTGGAFVVTESASVQAGAYVRGKMRRRHTGSPSRRGPFRRYRAKWGSAQARRSSE